MPDLAELVIAIRMLENAEYMDHSGHASIRRDESSFYINSATSVRGTLTEADIVACDLGGSVVSAGTARAPMEFPIHAEIYRAHPEVNAVIHTHPQWSTYLTLANIAPAVVYAQAAVLGELRVMDSPKSINTPEMGRRLVDETGDSHVVFLKAHGVVSAGTTLLECFAYAVYVEENARRQYMALQIGKPYEFSDDEVAEFRTRLHSPALFQKAWDYYLSKLR